MRFQLVLRSVIVGGIVAHFAFATSFAAVESLARDTDPEPTNTARFFGWHSHVGEREKGVQASGLETWHTFRLATGTRHEIDEYRDQLLEHTNSTQSVKRRLEVLLEGERQSYRFEVGARVVTINLDGDRVEHRNQGIGREKSPNIPDQLKDAFVIEDELLSCHQMAFSRIIGRAEKIEDVERAIDGRQIDAIIPSRLGVYRFGYRVVPRPAGDSSLTVEVTVHERVTTLAPSADLNLVRVFTLTPTGRITSVRIARQRRHEGTLEGHALEDRPGFAGQITTRTAIEDGGHPLGLLLTSSGVGTSKFDGTTAFPRRPAVVFVFEPIAHPAAGYIAHRLRHAMAPRGAMVYGTLELLVPPRPDGPGADRAIEIAVQKLRAQPTIDPERVHVVYFGDAQPYWATTLATCKFASCALVSARTGKLASADAAALVASLQRAATPLVCFTGALDLQADWSRLLATDPTERASGAPRRSMLSLAGVDLRMTGGLAEGVAASTVEIAERCRLSPVFLAAVDEWYGAFAR
ncbi:MAG: hypothetical protein ACKVX7_11800 [Planctomycetota bacterium]